MQKLLADQESRAPQGGLGIRARIFLLVLLALAPFAVLSVVQVPRRRAKNEQRAQQDAERLASVIQSQLDVQVGEVRTAVATLATALVPDAAHTSENDRRLLAAVRTLRVPLEVTLFLQTIDDQNVGTSYRPLPEGRDTHAAGRTYFIEAIAKPGVAVGEAVISRGEKRWSVQLASAVRDGAGRPIGVLVAGIRLDDLQRLVRNTNAGQDAVVTVVDQSGRILARSANPEKWIGKRAFTAEQQHLGRVGQLPTTIIKGIDGGQLMLANQAVRGVPWMVYVGRPLEVVYADARSELNRDLFWGGISALIALITAWLVGGRIVRPFRLLTSDVQALEAKGDLSFRSPVISRGEAGILAAAFNRMVGALQLRESDLRASEARYRVLFQKSPFPMWVVDRRGLAFLEVNDAAVRAYGWPREEFLRKTVDDLHPARADGAAATVPLVAGDITRDGTWHHSAKDGHVLDVEVSAVDFEYRGAPALLAVINDVTQRRLAQRALQETQDQLRHSQKMEAVGRLAGGIAHDFNNLLTVIDSYSAFVLEKLAPASPEAADVREIQTAATRAGALTRQLLAFSRQQPFEAKAVDLSATVTGLQNMLLPLLGESINLTTQAPPKPWAVWGDQGQLEQVIVNLALNARDAMPEGGTLVISTTNVEVDDDLAARHPPLVRGRYVRLAVSDTGIGMSDEIKGRVFEPFFTTKEVGRGTGLGLSTVYGIVLQAGGAITVETELGRGSTFDVYLPRAEGAQGEGVVTTARELRGGSETILVVEDEDAVRAVTCRILAARGYMVIEARDGSEALTMAAKDSGIIDLVLSDIVMPRMNGLEFAAKLRTIAPKVRIVFMSGYAEYDPDRLEMLGMGSGLVRKPFTADGLARIVRGVLDR